MTMAEGKREGSPDSRETIRDGVQEIEQLIGRQKYHEAMIRAGEILKLMVDILCAQEDIPDGSLIERIDELENHGVIDKNTYERYNRIRMIASRAKHENDNSAYSANQIHRLLAEEVYAFSGLDDAQKTDGAGRRTLREKSSAGTVRLAADRSERDNRFEREARQQSAARRAKRAEKAAETAENPVSGKTPDSAMDEALRGETASAGPESGKARLETGKAEPETGKARPEESTGTGSSVTGTEKAKALPEETEAKPDRENTAEEKPAAEDPLADGEDLQDRLSVNRSASRRRRAMNAGPSISPSAIIKPILLIAIIIVLLVIIRLLQPAGDTSGTAAETTAAESSADSGEESSSAEESAETGNAESGAADESAETAGSTESAESTAAAASETTAQAQAASASYRVKADVQTVRVRSTPKADDDTNIEGLLAAGDKVSYVGDQDDQWAIINYNGKQAYVAKQYIEKAE
jgi:hypothetical protein